MYGAMANYGFRFFDNDLASAITLSGQMASLWAEKHLNIFMNDLMKTENIDYVVAVDTDSAYLRFDTLVQKVFKGDTSDKLKVVEFLDQFAKKKINPYLKDKFNQLKDIMNSYDQHLDMKREKICERGIWTTKKRYVLSVWDKEGIRYEKPEISITGLEAIRSSTPEMCRNAMKKLYEIILSGTKEDTIKFVENFKQEFFKATPEQIAINKTANNISKFYNKVTLYGKATPIQCRAAIMFNHMRERTQIEKKYEKIQNSEKIKYVFLKMPNPSGENVIAFISSLPEEFGLHKYINYHEQFTKAFEQPLESVFQAIGWQMHDQSTLEGLFQ